VAEKIEENEFSRFLRDPAREELGYVLREVGENEFLRGRTTRAVFDDFESYVTSQQAKGVSFDDAHAQWIKDVADTLDRGIFTPTEMIQIRTQSNGLRNVVNNITENSGRVGDEMAQTLRLDRSELMLHDNRKLWQQLKGKPLGRVEHIFRILDTHSPGRAAALRTQFANDMRHQLLKKGKGADDIGYHQWYDDNKALIRAVVGDQYSRELGTLGNILRRRNDLGMVRGVAPEVNPTTIAFTRVLFGPLSRIQRGISAARRGQIRLRAASAADLITDPNKLKELVKLHNYPLESRYVSRTLQDLGFIDLFQEDLSRQGISTFDADNQVHREAFAQLVVNELYGEQGITPNGSQVEQ
jgi:hypothetical protein